MKKRYAQLALMMTSMMSSQLLGGVQATAANFEDVRHTSWLKFDDKQKLLDPDTSTEMLKIQRLLERSAQEIFETFERTQIIPESKSREYLNNDFSAINMFLVRQYMPALCSITAADVPQISADMEAAINIILDDPRSKIREFYKQNPDTSWQSRNPDDVQLLHIIEGLGFFTNKKFMDRLKDPEITQKWQDRDRLGIGLHLINSFTGPVTIDDITHILEKVDNLEAGYLCLYRPIVYALSYRIKTDVIKSMISELAQNVKSLLKGESDILCSYFVAHSKISARNDMSYIIDAVNTIPEKHHKTFKAFIEKSLKWSLIPEPIKMQDYISALVRCFESLPEEILKDLNFVETCGHFIRFVSENVSGKLTVNGLIRIIKAVSGLSNWKSKAVINYLWGTFVGYRHEDSLSFAEAHAIYTNLRRLNTNFYDVSRIDLMTAFFPKFSVGLLQSQNFIKFCNLFIKEMTPQYTRAAQCIESVLALFPEHSFKDERFINNCVRFIDKLSQKGASDVARIVKAVAGISDDRFDDEHFIACLDRIASKIPQQVMYPDILEAVAGLSDDRFKDERLHNILDHLIESIRLCSVILFKEIVKAIAALSNDRLNDERFHYILDHFSKSVQMDNPSSFKEMVEAVAKVSNDRFNDKRFRSILDQFINQTFQMNASGVERIVKAAAGVSNDRFTRFHYILGYFLKRIQTDRVRYRNVHLAEMVEVVAGISDAHLNNERFIMVCDDFIIRFGVSNICDIIQELSQFSTNLFDDKGKKNWLHNQKIINDHMQNYGLYPYSYKIVGKNDQ